MPSVDFWEQQARYYDQLEQEANESGDSIAGDIYHRQAAASRYAAMHASDDASQDPPLPSTES